MKNIATTTDTIEIKPSAATELRRIADQHEGAITPEAVVKAAKAKRSPLHPYFDWDDTSASKQWRIHQARMLICRIKVEYLDQDQESIKVRAYHNVSIAADDENEGSRFYVDTQTAMTVSTYRDQILANCRRDIATFKEKYRALKEVESIIDAMNGVEV
jgi:hypothetical protein